MLPLNNAEPVSALGYVPRGTVPNFSEMQLKSLVSIRNHSYPLSISNSVFKDNTALKGIIFIESSSKTESSVLIHNNTFFRNSAMFDSNVLEVRKRVTNLLSEQFFEIEDLQCGGFQISFNNFSSNIGCKNTFGALKAYCIDDANAATLKGNVTYSAQTDSQYFVGNLYSEKLLESNPSLIFDGLNEFNNEAYTTYLVNNQSFIVNKYRLVLLGNTWDLNFAGSKRSVVQIEGFPIVESSKETYSNN